MDTELKATTTPLQAVIGFGFALLVILVLSAALWAAMDLGQRQHPANACAEDDVWAAVTVGVERANVTRACVNHEEYARTVVAELANR